MIKPAGRISQDHSLSGESHVFNTGSGKRAPGRLRSGLLLIALLFSLTGCHGSGSRATFTVPESLDTDTEMEITFWAKNDTNKTQTQIYAQAIEDFEALYPNIHVTIRLYTNYDDIYNDVITNIATDTTPNVCITYPDHIATYLTGSNVMAPLDDLMTDERYGLGGSELLFDSPAVPEVIPEYLAEGVIDGVQYALPYMRSTEACYVNKTYVEAMGYELPETLTWDFIWEVSEAALSKDDDGNYLVNAQNVLIPFIYKSTDNMMIQMLRQYGAGYSTDDGRIELFNDTTTSILKTVGQHGASKAFSTFKISSYPANFLNAGQCLFAIDSTAGSTWMGSEAPLSDIADDKIVSFETAVYPVPQVDPNHPQMISQGPSVCVFNKENPQEVLASWLFAQFLLTDDVQIAYAQTEGYVPVTSKARETNAYQDYLARAGEDNTTHYQVKIDATQLLLENTENTFTTPVFNGSASLRNAAGQLIESTVKAARRKTEITDEFIEQLYEDTSQLYRLDQIGSSGGKQDLGPLSFTAKALIGSLIAAWICIALYALRNRRKLHGR